MVRLFGGEIGDDAFFAVGRVDRRQPRRLAHPGIPPIGANHQARGQHRAIVEAKDCRIRSECQLLRARRAEQREVALALGAFPELAGHQRRLEDPAKLRHAGIVGRKRQLAAGIATDIHGANRRDALGVEMLPGADPLEKAGIGRTDGIDARIPALRAPRRLIFDQSDAQGCVAQGDGKAGAGETAADDDQIKLLHGGETAGSL